MIKSKKQIYLTGCYKSGTEYITQLLSNHPNLSSTFDTNYMRYCYKRYDPVDKKWRQLLGDMNDILYQRFKKELNIEEITAECEKSDNITYGLLYDLIMSSLYLHDDVNMWADKIQLGWRHIPDFLEMFPSGKAIIIIRNPRAVLSSFKRHTYAPKPLYLGAVFNCYDSMKHAEIYQDLYPTRFMKVLYEDVLMDPEPNLENIFEFLGLSHDHELLSNANWKDPTGKKWEYNTSYPVEGKFDPIASMNKWKTELQDWEKAFCDKINRKYLDINNYEPANISTKIEIPDTEVFNDKIMEYLEGWLLADSGIQEFPTDPLNPNNWSVNK
jgi:hypothetical protein